jgi:trehalose-6-phosphate synthase
MTTDTYLAFVKQMQDQFSQGSVVTGKRRHIISSIDRFHPISGLKNKLFAYQKFMRDYPHFRTQACLVQYVVVSEELNHLNNEYAQTRAEILALIKEIQEEFGRGAIHY